MALKPYQTRFIELAIEQNALKFGSFELKSGRTSPYFFNAGQFSTGRSLLELSRCYADAIVDSGTQYDLLFGPAYKGIPLASSAASALMERHGISKPFSFNRKEAKKHGEGGSIVGAELKGDVMIVDDVITAGTAIREVNEIILDAGAKPVAVVIGIDRCERGQSEQSAVQEVEEKLGVTVCSIVTVHTIRDFLARDSSNAVLVSTIDEYLMRYGVALND